MTIFYVTDNNRCTSSIPTDIANHKMALKDPIKLTYGCLQQLLLGAAHHRGLGLNPVESRASLLFAGIAYIFAKMA